MAELKFILDNEKPDIVAISEVLPKNYSREMHLEYFKMDGYAMETNINEINIKTVRGCITYIKNGIDYKVINNTEPGIGNFKEHVTILINLKGNDKLLCSNMYRRGESSDENNESLLSYLKHLTLDCSYSHLVTMGDLNIKNIDWTNMSCGKNQIQIGSILGPILSSPDQ